MAYGDSPHDEALLAAWTDFCADLQRAGEQVFKDYNPAHPLQRADGFRFLTQNLGQAFDLALETKDTKYPFLHIFTTHSMKLGAGYNFTDFSDDLTDLSYRHQGAFINFVGTK